MKQNQENESEKWVIPVSSDSENSDKKGVTDNRTEAISEEKNESEYIEKLQRLQAEFSNYRKRNENERKYLFSISKGELVLKLLPVLDDFERMIQHHEGNCSYTLEGIGLIHQNLKKVLYEEGLEEIPAVGEIFNPELHEAVGIEKTGSDQDNMILEEWQKGYYFTGRLLRPSKVKVGKYDEQSDGSLQ